MTTVDDLTYLQRQSELASTRALMEGREQLVDASDVEPLTLDEVKAHLRVSWDDENAIIERYAKAARRSLENSLRHAFLPQQWDFALDKPPCDSAPILLPRAPLISVTSVTSYDTANAATVFSSGNYLQDTMSRPGRVALNQGVVWPAPSNGLRDTNAIVVRYTCGYADRNLIPDDLIAGLLLLIGTLYHNRESISAIQTFALPDCVEALVSEYRLPLM